MPNFLSKLPNPLLLWMTLSATTLECPFLLSKNDPKRPLASPYTFNVPLRRMFFAVSSTHLMVMRFGKLLRCPGAILYDRPCHSVSPFDLPCIPRSWLLDKIARTLPQPHRAPETDFFFPQTLSFCVKQRFRQEPLFLLNKVLIPITVLQTTSSRTPSR